MNGELVPVDKDGREIGWPIRLVAGEVLVGRRKTCDIVISFHSVRVLDELIAAFGRMARMVRQRFQFHLSSIFLVTTLAGVLCAVGPPIWTWAKTTFSRWEDVGGPGTIKTYTNNTNCFLGGRDETDDDTAEPDLDENADVASECADDETPGPFTSPDTP
jgi:hypothetical protein